MRSRGWGLRFCSGRSSRPRSSGRSTGRGWPRSWTSPSDISRSCSPCCGIGALPVWLIAFAITAIWAREAYGPRAMAMASALFALSPNLLAHGSLITMETPIVACSAAHALLLLAVPGPRESSRFRGRGGDRGASPGPASTRRSSSRPILALDWWFERWRRGEGRALPLAGRVARSMLGFLAIMAATNLVDHGLPPRAPEPQHGRSTPASTGNSRRWVGRMITRAVEMPVPAEFTGFVDPAQPPEAGGFQLPVRADPREGLVVLLFRLPGGEGAAHVLAARRRPPGPRPASRPARAATRMMWLSIAAFLAITADRLHAEFRHSLPAADGAGGDRLGFGHGGGFAAPETPRRRRA